MCKLIFNTNRQQHKKDCMKYLRAVKKANQEYGTLSKVTYMKMLARNFDMQNRRQAMKNLKSFKKDFMTETIMAIDSMMGVTSDRGIVEPVFYRLPS